MRSFDVHRCVRGALIAVAVLAAVITSERPALASTEAAIPPGQESLLEAMIGKGATLPGACRIAMAEVDHTFARATYTCPVGGDVSVVLTHPDAALTGSVETAQFAVAVEKGNPPPQLLDAILVLVRTHEPTFQWAFPGLPIDVPQVEAAEGGAE